MLVARDDMRADDICIGRFRIGDFLFQFLHDGIIQNSVRLVHYIRLEFLSCTDDDVYINCQKLKWKDE